MVTTFQIITNMIIIACALVGFLYLRQSEKILAKQKSDLLTLKGKIQDLKHIFNRTAGSYATGGDMDPAQKERTRQHFIEPATGYNDPAPTQKSKLLFYQGWRICSHKTSTLEHPDGRLMKVETATLWEIRELTRVEREMRDQLAMRAPVGNYTDLPKGEPVKTHEEARRIIVSLGGSSPEIDFVRNTMDQYHVDKSRAWLMRQFNRGRKFSPSSNPLGDTAAFMVKNPMSALGHFFETRRADKASFRLDRHRKGGRRG